MSPVLLFIFICLVGGALSILMGRHFPACLFQPLIRGVLYVAGVMMLLVGVYVGVMAHLHGGF